MNLISLNIWGGRVFEPLLDYVLHHADTDIFCFQEVFHTVTKHTGVDNYRANVFSELDKILSDHRGYFASVQRGWDTHQKVDYPLSWGIAMFLKDSLDVQSVDDMFIYGDGIAEGPVDTVPRKLQYAELWHKNRGYIIAHLHGLWVRGSKEDTPEREEQSRKIMQLLQEKEGSKVLCGDFNLRPDTKSLGVLEDTLVNLIKRNNISDTRGSLYTGEEPFADYTMVSPDVTVHSFDLPDVKVSDHLPMELQFS